MQETGVNYAGTFMRDIEHHSAEAPVRDAFQLMGAVTFVLVLLLIGWHAAHASGVWPA
jgi:hypothetical protein